MPSQSFWRSELRTLFCLDGQATTLYANEIADSIGQQFPLAMVGVASDPPNRAEEYVIGRDPDVYSRHEEFFTRTIPKWVKSEFGIESARERTALFGYSCGGNFATAMALAHRDKYVGAIAMSIAGRPVRVDQDLNPDIEISGSKFYLAAGHDEMSGMKNYMIRLEEWLNDNGAICKRSFSPGDHDLFFWTSQLHLAVPWIFSRS